MQLKTESDLAYTEMFQVKDSKAKDEEIDVICSAPLCLGILQKQKAADDLTGLVLSKAEYLHQLQTQKVVEEEGSKGSNVIILAML